MARHAVQKAERLERAPRNISEEAQNHRDVVGAPPRAEEPGFPTYEPGQSATLVRPESTGGRVEDAIAIIGIMVADGTPADPQRRVIEPGQVIPPRHLEGLTEGKHYTRGETVAQQRAKPVFFNGKAAKRALTCITGTDPDTGARKVYQVGETVPDEALAGLRVGVHFE